MTTASPETASRAGRVARLLAVVGGLNLIAVVIYGPVWWALNTVVYLARFHRGIPHHPGTSGLSDSVGLFALPVAWWVFAIGGFVALAVSVACWPRARRRRLGPDVQINPFNTNPGFLACAAFFTALMGFAWTSSYSGIHTVFDPYLAGPLIALAAGFVSFRRWQLDAAPVRSPRKSAQPSATARVLGAILFVDMLAIAVLGFGGIALNQLVYLSAHGGSIPGSGNRPSAEGTDIWPGHMPISLPWWLFAALSAVLVIIALLAWPRDNQFGPGRAGRVFFRRTTASILLVMGILAFFIETEVDLFYGSGRASSPAFVGPALCLVVIVLSLARLAAALVHALRGDSHPKRSPRARRPDTPKLERMEDHG